LSMISSIKVSMHIHSPLIISMYYPLDSDSAARPGGSSQLGHTSQSLAKSH
jgi:hypothetical protein